jgi:hypothetical protein
MDGLDVANVTEWNGRPRRQLKPPPKTYWEEYVETDDWYKKKLFEDIPDEEMWAACEDEDLSDAGEEDDESVEQESVDGEWISDEFPSDDNGDITEDTESV